MVGGEVRPLKDKVDDALKDGDTEVEFVLVAERTDDPVNMTARDFFLEEVKFL